MGEVSEQCPCWHEECSLLNGHDGPHRPYMAPTFTDPSGRPAQTDHDGIAARIHNMLCDTKDCTNKGEWLCKGGVIACDTHKEG